MFINTYRKIITITVVLLNIAAILGILIASITYLLGYRLVHDDFVAINWEMLLVISLIILCFTVTIMMVLRNQQLSTSLQKIGGRIKSVIPKEYYAYFIVLALLTGIVLPHWERCVNMQFFNHFDGYNILFIVWIAVILLSMFRIDFNGIAFGKKEQLKTEVSALKQEVAQATKNISVPNSEGEL